MPVNNHSSEEISDPELRDMIQRNLILVHVVVYICFVFGGSVLVVLPVRVFVYTSQS